MQCFRRCCCFRDRLFGSILKMYSCYFTLGQCAINQYSCVYIHVYLGWSFMDLQYTMTFIIIFPISCRLELQVTYVYTYCIRYFIYGLWSSILYRWRTVKILNSYDNRLQQNFTISSYSLFYDLLQNLPISFQVHVLHRLSYEPRHEKTNILHMRKQRRRSASR